MKMRGLALTKPLIILKMNKEMHDVGNVQDK